MNRLEKIDIDDKYFENVTFLRGAKNDINEAVDVINNEMWRYYNLQKVCIGNEEILNEMDKIEKYIDGQLFIIRDRISLMKEPTFFTLVSDEVKSSLIEQLDTLYDKCKARKDFI